MSSKKRPLWLVWQNQDAMPEGSYKDFKIIFKNGDGESKESGKIRLQDKLSTLFRFCSEGPHLVQCCILCSALPAWYSHVICSSCLMLHVICSFCLILHVICSSASRSMLSPFVPVIPSFHTLMRHLFQCFFCFIQLFPVSFSCLPGFIWHCRCFIPPV